MAAPIHLKTFLEDVTCDHAVILPVVHSTRSANVLDLLNSKSIAPTHCKVFRDDLVYLFVGRPAYKWALEEEPSYWQCPTVFVFESEAVKPFKRIFPFDTGAFKSKRLPSFVTMFSCDVFEVSEASEIGAVMNGFYGGAENYFYGRAKPTSEMKQEYRLGVKHQHIEALSRLYSHPISKKLDDRARAIEIQVTHPIALNRSGLIGVVMPEPYAMDEDVVRFLSELDCSREFYSIYPINIEGYFGRIYDSIERIYRTKGIFK